MAPRQFHPNDEINNDLRHINDELRTEAYDKRFFVPKFALRNYLTPERVKKLLRIASPHSIDWEEVCDRYLAVFVILLSIQEGIYIASFLQHSYLADSHLPFTEASILPIECRKFFQNFDKIQWEYCAKNLGPDDLHDKVLHPKIVVPIISQHFLKSGDSTTSRVEVHPDYNCLISPLRRDTNAAPPRFVVLKTSPLRHENLHQNEVRAYTILRRQKDISDNIARFHGSWKQSNTCNILLEYIEGGTLEDLFRDNRATAWDVLSFWTRLLAILKPVCRIHCQGDPEFHDSVEHGVHQDIKPQNILVARSNSATTFDAVFKLADLGLTYLPRTETGPRKERWGRDTPGTQMYSAPECFRSEDELFILRTVQPADCKKDVWSLACVLSEAVVWWVLGASGLADYRALRRAETTKLPGLYRTAYGGCFHDGEKVLPAVQKFHDEVRRSRGTFDLLSNDVLPIIEEMFAPVAQRPSALIAYTKLRAATETAQRLSYPPVFRVSPETSHSPQFPAAGPGAATGLGIKHTPAQQNHLHVGRRSLNNTNPISLPSTSRLINGDFNPPTDTFENNDSASFTPKPIGRSLSDQIVRTPSIASPVLQRIRFHTQNAPEERRQETVHFENQQLPDHAGTSSNDWSVGMSGDPSLVVAEEHRDDSHKKYATITQVSVWLRDKRLGAPCPVFGQELTLLHGTDQIFIVDNSESMRKYSREVNETFAALSYLVKRFDRDGMDLHFTTSNVTDHGHHRASMISKLNKTGYHGKAYMDITLGKVLESSNTKRPSILKRFSHGNNCGKSIFILTDGKWYGDDNSLCGIPELVKSVTQHMGSRWKLGIQFIQFGSDEVGTRRLKRLDDDLQEFDIMDIIDTEPHNGNVYKMLLGHRTKAWD